MAATRSSKAAPIGSSQWIQNERDQADDFVTQEVEEFGYSVRNELEWLNEHMADIFTKTQTNFADMFKTPGKLRGKTPRTARKRDATAPRQPLTDIFAPNATLPAPASATKTSFYDKVAQLQVPQDENQAPTHKPVSRGTSPQRAGKPYTDSGYHGMMTEDEMEVDAIIQSEGADLSSQAGDAQQKVPLRDDQPPAQRVRDGKGDDTGASDDSFVSAKEQESDVPVAADEEMAEAPAEEQAEAQAEEDEVMQDENMPPQVDEIQIETGAETEVKASEPDQDHDVDMNVEESPQSDGSSPQKPLQRKSSFTFSSLPAREPLGAKRSMGQVDRHRSSFFGKSMNKASQNDADDELSQEKPAENRVHNKSSTQLLHERLNMLGKTKEPRSSKSIPQSAFANQPSYPQLPDADQPNSQATEVDDLHERVAAKTPAALEDDEDDWIAPTKSFSTSQKEPTKEHDSPARPAMHQKSISTNFIPSPRPEMATDARHQKAISISHPNLAEALETTTPAGSPAAKKNNDGPLSASKSRLWSALKSAKSIFASSASASAAAKLEAHNSPAPATSPRRDSGESKMFNMPGALYTQKDLLARNNSVISFSPSRKTRNSGESDKKREKELKAQQKAEEELEKAREKERQKAAKQLAEEKAKAEKAEKAEVAKQEKERKQADKQKAPAAAERPISADSEKASESDAGPSKSLLPSGKLKAPGRLVRPTRNEPAQSKPAPVSIRVASQSQRLGQGSSAQSSFSKSQGPGAAPQPTPKDAGPRASSAMGFRPGSAAPGNSRVKALEAAARKKEADERAAAKKAEQKRELERKRAEKAEQEKRAEEERKAAEQQRVQEAKQAAQRRAQEKQAAEARKREQERADQQRREHERQEQSRREQERIDQQRREAEQWRQQEDARKAREAHELADRIRQERAQQAQSHGRSDVPGTLRQLTKHTVPAINPAKPAKRQLPPDDDEPAHQPQRPGLMRGPASYQQADAKRRRTNEEQDEPNNERRSVMAPPKRPSTLRKETMPKFSHGYTHAPPPAAHHASMFKATVTAQHQMQHGSKPAHPSQLAQMSNARIPFAENSNPPYQPSSSQQMHPGYENAPPNKFKTPARPQHAPKSAKSTPHYPQGDNIELPDIATDSEDESDDEETGGGFRAPSWVASPALRDLLTQQQLVDPETVFGPIGELKMDEVFKNSKNQERLKRFRDRGSSALWTETGDAVTSAEKRKDMEMRERVVRDGGWRYEPNA